MLGRSKQAWTNEREIRITDDEGQPAVYRPESIQHGPDFRADSALKTRIHQVDVDIILDEGPRHDHDE